MSDPPGGHWYRSAEGARAPTEDDLRGAPKRPLVDRALDHRLVAPLASRLLEPRVRGRVMVIYNREGRRADRRWAGMFSEIHSVLGALWYARRRGAAGVRVDFRSPFYLDPARGPNWWEYFFERSLIRFDQGESRGEVHLTGTLARYGRYFGFGDLVNGPTPFLYPMTWGIPRAELAELVGAYLPVRAELRARVDRFAADHFAVAPLIVGVHYRGTDTARHYPYYRIPYEPFLDEVERVLAARAPADFRVFVATDEAPFLDLARRRYGPRVLCWPDSPRVAPDAGAVHFSSDVAPYRKGESALIDCLLLAETNYLVKSRSNLSDTALLFSAGLPYSLCLR